MDRMRKRKKKLMPNKTFQLVRGLKLLESFGNTLTVNGGNHVPRGVATLHLPLVVFSFSKKMSMFCVSQNYFPLFSSTGMYSLVFLKT